MLFVSAVNAVCALAIAFTISNIFQAGRFLDLSALRSGEMKPPVVSAQTIDWSQSLKSFVPESLLSPFLSNAIPTVILLALLFGFAARQLEKTEHETALQNIHSLIKALLFLQLKVLDFFIHLVPLAVFASVAKVVGEHGFGMFKGLGAYLVVTLSGMAAQIFLIYQVWIFGVARFSWLKFWREARVPALYAFGVNSSLATLPVTLKSLSQLKVTPTSSRLAACVGTNLNNDGILLYEVVAVLFVAQAYGISLDIWHQFAIAGVCLMATLGVAGIPEAGIISLILVLNTVSLPTEVLPLLLTVDWIVARFRSVTNVIADMTVAIATDKLVES